MSSLIKKVISTAKAPGAIGPYSQAVLVDKTMYISGQLGMDPASGQLVSGGVAEEAKQALINIGEILKAGGCDYTNVVKTTVLLADINDFNAVNEIYKQYFKSSFPARAAYQVAALPKRSKGWSCVCTRTERRHIELQRGNLKKQIVMTSLMKKIISTEKAPQAIGPYSQSLLINRTLYVSGQVGRDPKSGKLVSGGVAEEFKQALINVGEILKAGGCDFSNGE
uniref:2-iminobutanoate/2-iminopropanoate deaminase n=1 Tax=Sarcophilus harrisii TaxID=9305 RepID=A0A7N4P5Z6_SARHA